MADATGFFITFEGIEGCGKSTQIGLLGEYLRGRGIELISTREPGSTPVGEAIRDILLNDSGEGISPTAELLLYEAARVELVGSVIKPALDDGLVVLCDRFTDSTIAYQAGGRGLDRALVEEANRMGSLGVSPELTLLLDCEVEAGLKRALKRIEANANTNTNINANINTNNEAGPEGGVGENREDRFEKEGIEFHTRVREAFLELAEAEPKRVRVIDATGEIAVIHKEICDIMDIEIASGRLGKGASQ